MQVGTTTVAGLLRCRGKERRRSLVYVTQHVNAIVLTLNLNVIIMSGGSHEMRSKSRMFHKNSSVLELFRPSSALGCSVVRSPLIILIQRSLPGGG